MRLDKFLKVSRIIKRRTVANEACDNGRVSVKVAKASSEIKSGDIIEIRFGDTPKKYEVTEVKEIVGKNGSADMYRIIE